MRREERLISHLKAYNETDMYPFHMPGHKRLAGAEDGEMGELEFPNPFTVDITEIEGFDNLHHPEGDSAGIHGVGGRRLRGGPDVLSGERQQRRDSGGHQRGGGI